MKNVHAHIIGGSPLFREGLLHVLTPLAHRFTGISVVASLPELTAPTTGGDHLLLCFLPRNRRRLLACLAELPRFRAAAIVAFGPTATIKEIRRLVGLGVSAYLLHAVCADDIRRAIDQALAGDTFVDPQLRRQWVDCQFTGTRTGGPGSLTRRETEVLQHIVREHTTEEIADLLFISRCTVETHRANILAKLGVKNTAGLVREAVVNQLCLV